MLVRVPCHTARGYVSIHAPRFREAMRCRPRCGSCRRLCFNPRPPFPGGDARRRPAARRRLASFNPRPPFPGGDACLSARRTRRNTCFNPRPPFPGGDAERRVIGHAEMIVSIHAPRFREAMPLAASCILFASNLFQSTPPVSGRRCALVLNQTTLPTIVSIHAPRFREAMRRAGYRRRMDQACFNPRPPFPGGDAPCRCIHT